MLVELDEDQRLLRETIRKFVEKEVVPKAQEIDHEDRFPRDLFLELGKFGLLAFMLPDYLNPQSLNT